jgi:hypothetical protein
MTRITGSGRSRRSEMAYFIRRSGDDCAVIALQPDDSEEVVARALAIGRAEDLCVSKMEALRSAAATLPLAEARPAPAAPKRKKHGGRQLVFTFE